MDAQCFKRSLQVLHCLSDTVLERASMHQHPISLDTHAADFGSHVVPPQVIYHVDLIHMAPPLFRDWRFLTVVAIGGFGFQEALFRSGGQLREEIEAKG
eukprot:3196727-Amphidinium_carterae.2